MGGGSGKERCGLMSLINTGSGLILSLSATHHMDFQGVPRRWKGQGDGHPGQIDGSFSDGSDAGPIKPWVVFHRLGPENIPHVVRNRESISTKSSSLTLPLPGHDFVYHRSGYELGLRLWSLLASPWCS